MENEVTRYRSENIELKKNVTKLEKVIYGKSIVKKRA